MEMISLLYGKFYKIRKLACDTADQGHRGVARERVYLILTHKWKVKEVVDPRELYLYVSKYLKTHIHTEPKDYAIAEPLDIHQEASELAWVRRGTTTISNVASVAWADIVNKCCIQEF